MNLRPKVAALADVRLDFAEVDEDTDIREAINHLKEKAANPSQTPTKSKLLKTRKTNQI